jgi:hypothetical protein
VRFAALRNRFWHLLTLVALLALGAQVLAQTDPLPSWNDGPAKRAIVDFVQTTTDQSSPTFVPPEARIATFDQDGTLWVEHPMYSQVIYCLERVPAVVKAKPELAKVEPFPAARTRCAMSHSVTSSRGSISRRFCSSALRWCSYG